MTHYIDSIQKSVGPRIHPCCARHVISEWPDFVCRGLQLYRSMRRRPTQYCFVRWISIAWCLCIYKVLNNSSSNNGLVYFKNVYDCHQHNTGTNDVNFYIRFSRTTMKATSLCRVLRRLQKYGMKYAIVWSCAIRFRSSDTNIKYCSWKK